MYIELSFLVKVFDTFALLYPPPGNFLSSSKPKISVFCELLLFFAYFSSIFHKNFSKAFS